MKKTNLLLLLLVLLFSINSSQGQNKSNSIWKKTTSSLLAEKSLVNSNSFSANTEFYELNINQLKKSNEKN